MAVHKNIPSFYVSIEREVSHRIMGWYCKDDGGNHSYTDDIYKKELVSAEELPYVCAEIIRQGRLPVPYEVHYL